ncbi:MAG: non-ribosomal peptide synthetase [Candidatus Aminicenantes bacterium]|nr:MAG: non-ribosomal peptide synthetase [Candidatus Aminicenantes bacterium]
MEDLVNLTIHRMFELQAKKTPARIALVFQDRHITYRQLNERANQLAWFLREKGFQKNQLAVVMFDKGIEMIVCMLGIMKAGGAFVPLDPAYPIHRLQAIISDISPFLYIMEQKYLDMIFTILPGESKNHFYAPGLVEEQVNVFPTDNPDDINIPLDVAHIFYTTGSTGEPKGIMGPHRLVLHSLRWFIKAFAVTSRDRFGQLEAFSYDACLRSIFIPFSRGATVCVINEETKHNPANLIEWLERMKVTIMQAVPTILGSMLKQLESMENPGLYFKTLRYIALSGETLPARYVQQWMRIYKEKPRLVNMYGTTETLNKSSFFINKYPVNPDKSIPIGKGIDNTELLILKNGKLCSIGREGELYIRSPYMTLGYFKKEKKTKEVFLQNPLHNNYRDIVYKTGDLARYLQDGNVEFLRRIDTQVKIRGHRVELGEIESKLLSHKKISHAAVVYKEIKDNEKELLAYIVLKKEVEQINLKELRDYLGKYLPGYMVPSFFITLDKMPLNNSGKTDRKALPFSKDLILKTGNEYAPPRTALEKRLVEIWQDVLEMERIGIDEDFFALGGHSLKAVQLFSRIHKEFNASINLRNIFSSPTIREMALVVEAVDFVKKPSGDSNHPREEIIL